MSAACLSLANKKARLSVLVRGARLCHALLKACDSPLNYMARRHPKGKGYRLASHVSAFQRSQFSRDKVCNSLADPVGPPGDGSRHRAMLLGSSKRSEISIPNWRREGKRTRKVLGGHLAPPREATGVSLPRMAVTSAALPPPGRRTAVERRPYRAARRDASPHHAVAQEHDPSEAGLSL